MPLSGSQLISVDSLSSICSYRARTSGSVGQSSALEAGKVRGHPRHLLKVDPAKVDAA